MREHYFGKGVAKVWWHVFMDHDVYVCVARTRWLIKTGPLCTTACNFRNIGQIGT